MCLLVYRRGWTLKLRNRPPAVLLYVTLLMLLASISTVRGQNDRQVMKPPTWDNKPVSTEEMNRRVEEAVIQYQRYAPVPRIGFYDVAHPADSQEYLDLGGNAVMLLTVLVQDKAELPLKRVYIEVAGEEVELQLIALVL